MRVRGDGTATVVILGDHLASGDYNLASLATAVFVIISVGSSVLAARSGRSVARLAAGVGAVVSLVIAVRTLVERDLVAGAMDTLAGSRGSGFEAKGLDDLGAALGPALLLALAFLIAGAVVGRAASRRT